MTYQFAERMSTVHRSFIREILKVTESPEIISFGGGLPNPKSFPVNEVAGAAHKVLCEDGMSVLQYSTTEGYPPLREYIAARYRKKGVNVTADEILITNGSQQGIDLIAKVFLNKGDNVIVERPTYLAALQSFGIFEPKFLSVPLDDDGIDTVALEDLLKTNSAKICYGVPNFQNPTGITYSLKKRKEAARILKDHGVVFIEDNPYEEIRFIGQDQPSMRCFNEDTVMFGSFSKTVSPGMRLGWICARKEIMDKIIVVKQAADLHSNYFTQRVVYQYLKDNDVETHIQKIRGMYKEQRDAMVSAMERHFPEEVRFTRPEGGMFLWVTLPDGISSMDLFEIAIKENVAFVPGQAFYADGSGRNTLRMNYSSSDEDKIEEGVKRLAMAINKLIQQKKQATD